MSFVYPRTITISRPEVQAGAGNQGYFGLSPGSETPVASDLPASIQEKKEGRNPDAGLPSDIAKRTMWRIFIPAGSAANGLIQDRDIVTDDSNVRYQVGAAYWNSLGYNLLAERLEN
jgi:hypothetical protein